MKHIIYIIIVIIIIQFTDPAVDGGMNTDCNKVRELKKTKKHPIGYMATWVIH